MTDFHSMNCLTWIYTKSKITMICFVVQSSEFLEVQHAIAHSNYLILYQSMWGTLYYIYSISNLKHIYLLLTSILYISWCYFSMILSLPNSIFIKFIILPITFLHWNFWRWNVTTVFFSWVKVYILMENLVK